MTIYGIFCINKRLLGVLQSINKKGHYMLDVKDCRTCKSDMVFILLVGYK